MPIDADKVGWNTINSVPIGAKLTLEEFDKLFYERYLTEIGPFPGSGMPGHMGWALHHRRQCIRHLHDRFVEIVYPKPSEPREALDILTVTPYVDCINSEHKDTGAQDGC
jgi:hypothetical protein